MALELVYTSAPKGIISGSSDYCTVAFTEGMPVNLTKALESLSGLRFLKDESIYDTPTCHLHYRIAVGVEFKNLISQIKFSGFDHTGRTNHLAHHLLLDASERPAAGPAWLCSQESLFYQKWEEEPKLIKRLKLIPDSQESETSMQAKAWGDATNDAGWAGVVADSLLAAPDKAVAYIIFEPGIETLPLVREVLALVPQEDRWRFTFNTHLDAVPPGIKCSIRCCLPDSPALAESARLKDVIILNLTDLKRTGKKPDRDTPLILLARNGPAKPQPENASSSDDPQQPDKSSTALSTAASENLIETEPQHEQTASSLQANLHLNGQAAVSSVNNFKTPPPPPKDSQRAEDDNPKANYFIIAIIFIIFALLATAYFFLVFKKSGTPRGRTDAIEAPAKLGENLRPGKNGETTPVPRATGSAVDTARTNQERPGKKDGEAAGKQEPTPTSDNALGPRPQTPVTPVKIDTTTHADTQTIKDTEQHKAAESVQPARPDQARPGPTQPHQQPPSLPFWAQYQKQLKERRDKHAPLVIELEAVSSIDSLEAKFKNSQTVVNVDGRRLTLDKKLQYNPDSKTLYMELTPDFSKKEIIALLTVTPKDNGAFEFLDKTDESELASTISSLAINGKEFKTKYDKKDPLPSGEGCLARYDDKKREILLEYNLSESDYWAGLQKEKKENVSFPSKIAELDVTISIRLHAPIGNTDTTIAQKFSNKARQQFAKEINALEAQIENSTKSVAMNKGQDQKLKKDTEDKIGKYKQELENKKGELEKVEKSIASDLQQLASNPISLSFTAHEKPYKTITFTKKKDN